MSPLYSPNVTPGIEPASDERKGCGFNGRRDNPTAKLGWRFTAGVVLIVGGYAAWPLIPVVITADLPAWAKSGLAAILGATPFISKVVAIVLMGRPAYEFFKRNALKFLHVSSGRSRS